MRTRWVFVTALLVGLAGPSPALTEQYTVKPSPQGPTSVDTREVCTTISWGDDSSRTECLTDTPRSDPALHGICTIYYGRRVCH